MFKANEVERKIREVNLLIDMQINLSSFRISDHFFLAVSPAIVMRLTWKERKMHYLRMCKIFGK